MIETDETTNGPLNRLARGPRPAPDGIWDRIGPLTGRNRVAAAFYDGPSWAQFRVWERLFLTFQGGAKLARRQILRHLDPLQDGMVLEVGIGDGENLRFTPPGWTVYGVDVARRPLLDCLNWSKRDQRIRSKVEPFPIDHPLFDPLSMHDKLIWAEAEALPFNDACFDACYSIGGFTYFGDHARALSEMARVTKPGGLLVVADELPHIYRYGIGRLIGRPRFINFWLRFFKVDPDFARMVLDYNDDPEAAIRAAWPGATRHAIWSGLGYCYSAIRPDRFSSLPEPAGERHDDGPADRS